MRAFLLLLMLTGCAAEPVVTRQPISIITVSADLDTLPAGAPVYWGRLGADLQAELARRLVADISNKGGVLLVDLDEGSLAAAWASGFAADQAGLSALVTLTSSDGQVIMRQRLEVRTGEAPPDAASYAAGSSEYYAALIRTFADRVVMAINPTQRP